MYCYKFTVIYFYDTSVQDKPSRLLTILMKFTNCFTLIHLNTSYVKKLNISNKLYFYYLKHKVIKKYRL